MNAMFKELIVNVQIAQDADLHSVTESLLHLHHHATIVTSLKTWLRVLRNLLKHVEEAEQSTETVSQQMQSTDMTSSARDTVSTEHSTSSHVAVDPKYVQLLGDKATIEEKISRFIDFKQMQNDNSNIQEFCGGMKRSWCESAEDSGGCARTQAVYHPWKGTSRVIVKRVVNQSGPQIANYRQDAVSRHKLQTVTAGSASQTAEFPLPTGINERLSSMEAHVKLYAGRPIPGDVYERIQNLESRILQLESLSPEYFDMMPTHSYDRQKRPRTVNVDTKAFAPYKNLTDAEVDSKIMKLKQVLARKMQ